MHIPDGFLSAEVAGATAVAAAGAVAYGLRSADRRLDDRTVPLLGVTGAFIFAAQMLNFPVAAGTSGHLLGAALATALLGPWLACVVLAVVLGVQALMFADGGITALGANVFNMGVVGTFGAAAILWLARPLAARRPRALIGAAAVAAWLAVMLAALATSAELALSGTLSFGTVAPAMLGVHALIGIGEAVITAAALSAVLAARPDLIAARPARPAFVVQGV